MEADKKITLSLLEEIEAKEGNISQRDLSQRLGVSLGYINSYVKGLIRKGMLKVSQAPKKRFLYYITPKGFMEKASLTMEYARYMMGQYGQIRQMVYKTVQELNDDKKTRIALCGRTELSEICLLALMELDLQPVGIFEIEKSEDLNWLGRNVLSLGQLDFQELDCLLLGYWPEEDSPILKTLIENGADLKKVYFPNGAQPEIKTQVVFTPGKKSWEKKIEESAGG